MKNNMPGLWWIKFCIVLVIFFCAIFYSLPSFLLNSKQVKNDALSTNFIYKIAKSILPAARINLGLDLQGGLALSLDVELSEAVKETLIREVQNAQNLLTQQGIKIANFTVQKNNDVTINLDNAKNISKLQNAILDHSNLLLYNKSIDNKVYFEENKPAIMKLNKQIMDQAINTIRSRIDQFGVVEPNIFQAGNNRIIVELPGLNDMEHAKKLLGNTAKLDFRMVLNQVPQNKLNALLNEAKTALQIEQKYLTPSLMEDLSQWLRDNNKIPKNSTILLQHTNIKHDINGLNEIPYLVQAHPLLSGEMIEDAQAIQSTQNFIPQYEVSLKFKPQGAKLFANLTSEAIKAENNPHAIAIILDREIQSVPVVNSPILGGNASITMGHSSNLTEQMKNAQDLALVLRAGALPASVKIVEERQIGPSEGEQNIRAGLSSAIIAALLVSILMLVIYGISGLVANIAMCMNLLLILACMAIFGATLTLPGIAGMVLTMAIAVDGNVIINERIREEVRAGLSQKNAFYKGYATSFRTLIDAHITAAVAGFVLLIYGNAAVKGFAITLLCGIICTLFTSYYVTKVIGQWFIEKTNFKRFA